MPWSKLFRCFPRKSKKKNAAVDINGNNTDAKSVGDEFTSKQKAKAIAIVLSGYDVEIAAVSVPCDVERVTSWVEMYRPPFFEKGMRCPPALILWWMKELERKETESSGKRDAAPLVPAGGPSSVISEGPELETTASTATIGSVSSFLPATVEESKD